MDCQRRNRAKGMEKDVKKEIGFENCVATENQSQFHKTNTSIAEGREKGKEEEKQMNYPVSKTMTEILDTEYGCQLPVVERLLFPGCYLLVGAPKIGKSFFCMQLAIDVSLGNDFLGCFKVEKSEVLYYALEDTELRIQMRYTEMNGFEDNDSFHVVRRINLSNAEFEKEIIRELQIYPNIKIVIIDTLQRARASCCLENLNAYDADYNFVSHLKRLADMKKICILLVHHTRKKFADDVFDEISGTNGLLGAADGAMILKKDKRNQNTAILTVTGRDIPDQEIRLYMEMSTHKWIVKEILTDQEHKQEDELILAIVELVKKHNGEWRGTYPQLLEIFEKESEYTSSTLSRKINTLCSTLRSEYNISLETKKKSTGKIICFSIENK